MTIKDFNNKYTENGGIKQLSDMRENLVTLKDISEHFDVSIERVRQWMIDFFEERYDPRYERRKRTIEAIEKLIDKHGIKRTKDLYPGINKSYLQSAINSVGKSA